MKKISIFMIGCLLSGSLGMYSIDLGYPQPTKRKAVTIPRFFSEGYIKGLSTDEIEELIRLLKHKIKTSSGRALKKYEKMKKFAEDTLRRYETYADRM